MAEVGFLNIPIGNSSKLNLMKPGKVGKVRECHSCSVVATLRLPLPLPILMLQPAVSTLLPTLGLKKTSHLEFFQSFNSHPPSHVGSWILTMDSIDIPYLERIPHGALTHSAFDSLLDRLFARYRNSRLTALPFRFVGFIPRIYLPSSPGISSWVKVFLCGKQHLILGKHEYHKFFEDLQFFAFLTPWEFPSIEQGTPF